MGQHFIVEGGFSLKGTFLPSGNKNSTLPLLAATILTDQPITFKNLPPIQDVEVMLSILEELGSEIARPDAKEVTITNKKIKTTHLNRDLCKKIRASLLLAGPMLARCGEIFLPPPGGDVIGRRRIDTHLVALEALGSTTSISDNYEMRAPGGLTGNTIYLDETSVTATENTIMAAVLSKGTTTINNAASEPHVQELCRCLNSLGAKISGVGSNIITIQGVHAINGGTHTIESDFMEIGSMIGLATITNSEILIKNANPKIMHQTLIQFNKLGVSVEIRGNDIFVPSDQKLEINPDIGGAIPKIVDSPWPGFPPDLISIAIVIATQAKGAILIFDWMYESRMFFVDKLISMGAQIVLCDPHRVVVTGPSKLHGMELTSPDIRAGMTLLIAALCADGESIIWNIQQLDRGYDKIEERLIKLGAKINRIES